MEIEYLPHRLGANSPPVWELAADAFSNFVRSGRPGDVLVFMPGSFEINQTLEAIRLVPESKGFILLPLHGELPPRDQDAAVARYEQRKVVVATNVAETSITIDGVRLVIDSGLARIPRYDANRGINTLLIEKTSQSSADQRAGRAGRTAPGNCMRLWSRPEHDERAPHELPEIKRLDLAEVVLTLKAAGVEALRAFRWLEKPDEISLTHAEELLLDLGALRRTGVAPVSNQSSAQAAQKAGDRCDACPTVITNLGHRMLAFPVHPRYSRMLVGVLAERPPGLFGSVRRRREPVRSQADPSKEGDERNAMEDIGVGDVPRSAYDPTGKALRQWGGGGAGSRQRLGHAIGSKVTVHDESGASQIRKSGSARKEFLKIAVRAGAVRRIKV